MSEREEVEKIESDRIDEARLLVPRAKISLKEKVEEKLSYKISSTKRVSFEFFCTLLSEFKRAQHSTSFIRPLATFFFAMYMACCNREESQTPTRWERLFSLWGYFKNNGVCGWLELMQIILQSLLVKIINVEVGVEISSGIHQFLLILSRCVRVVTHVEVFHLFIPISQRLWWRLTMSERRERKEIAIVFDFQRVQNTYSLCQLVCVG